MEECVGAEREERGSGKGGRRRNRRGEGVGGKKKKIAEGWGMDAGGGETSKFYLCFFVSNLSFVLKTHQKWGNVSHFQKSRNLHICPRKDDSICPEP